MRCDEIREQIIEFVYDEGDIPPTNVEIMEHLRTCSTCSGELNELKQTRKYLQLWKDESPLRSVAIVGRETVRHQKFGWKCLRYAAIAAMVLISFLALANTKITWDKNGFSYSTHLFASKDTGRDYYTKAELRQLVKQALDDSEFRTNEVNYLMMQKMLDMVERDQWMDLRLVRGKASQNHSGN